MENSKLATVRHTQKIGTPHALDPSQCRETRSRDSSDVWLHSDVGVQVDTKIPDWGHRQHWRIANANWTGQDLVLTTRWRTPEDFGLRRVELQSIAFDRDEWVAWSLV